MSTNESKTKFRIRTIMAVVAVLAVGLWFYVDRWPKIQYWWKNRHVLAALDKPVAMPFAKGAPLAAIIKHIRISTTDPSLPSGVPVYVDPAVGAKMGSTVTIDRTSTPLKTGLRDALTPLGLEYQVQNGLLTITRRSSP